MANRSLEQQEEGLYFSFGNYAIYKPLEGENYQITDCLTDKVIASGILFENAVEHILKHEKENPEMKLFHQQESQLSDIDNALDDDLELAMMNDITIAALKLIKAAKSNNMTVGNMSAVVLNTAIQIQQNNT